MTTIVERIRAKVVPHLATVTSRADLTESVVEISCTSPTTFEAGQVLAVRVDGHGPGPTGTWRRFTIAGATGDEFRLVIQRNPGGAAARLIDTLATGDTLTIRGPASAVLPSVGDGPLLIVTDLTGLATTAALIRHMRCANPICPVQIAVSNTNDIDPSIIAGVVGTTADDVVVHTDHEHIGAWVRGRAGDNRNNVRLLGIGEHDLVEVARHAALASSVAPARIRTRTFWKPGRRGLE